jgi:UDP-N-acetylmuramyl pentapeptide phosphotransferase/UDP-N-acetylglucosamine-1-phosphate transferase
MGYSVLDLPGLFVAALVALVVAVATILARADRDSRRGWVVALGLSAVLFAIGFLDLQRQQPRETHVATIILGAIMPAVGAMATIRGTRRVSRLWIRWPLIFVAAFILLFAGLLFGATVVPRFLPF